MGFGMDQATKIRPSGVVVIAVLMGWGGLLTIASIFPPLAPTEIPRWMIGINIALGIAMLMIAWGLYALRTWAYIATVGIQALNALFAFITVITEPRAWPAWIALLIAGLIIAYLVQRRVRNAFGAWSEV